LPAGRTNAWRLSVALVASILLHAGVIGAVRIGVPVPLALSAAYSTLEVVLVNSKSVQASPDTRVLAQSNLDRGGGFEEGRHATSPLPAAERAQAAQAQVGEDRAEVAVSASRDKPALHNEHEPGFMSERKHTKTPAGTRLPERPAAALHHGGDAAVHTAAPSPEATAVETAGGQLRPQPEIPSGADLAARGIQIARLEAQIEQQIESSNLRPRRRFIGARTTEYRFARYVEDWRTKVEMIGNLNYPEEAKARNLHGSLQLTVAIRSDGRVEKVEVNRPSGHRVLDAAAVRIVELAAPFQAFPEDIRKDTDVLYITRTWRFTRSDQLEAD
jgi:periplasmic protein TonB